MSLNFLYKNNPQADDDLIIDLLEADKNFLHERNLDYKSLKNTLSPNIFMSITQFTQNLFKKHAIIAYLGSFLLITTLIGITAEAAAPVEYKPSTLIQKFTYENNLQQDKNPYTALKPDAENDVVISQKCDLAIKYPKQFNGSKLVVYSFTEDPYIDQSKSKAIGLEYLLSFEKADYTFDPTDFTNSGPQSLASIISVPTISCTTKAPIGLDEFQPGEKSIELVYPDNYTSQYGLEKKNLGRDFILENFGWFIAEVDTLKYRIYEASNGLPGFENNYMIYFEYNNLHYLISASTNNNVDSFGGNKVQFQFNSLVKNEANTEIKERENTAPQDISTDKTLSSLVAGKDNAASQTQSPTPNTVQTSANGKISGSLTYSSSEIPAMRICAETLEKQKVKCIDTKYLDENYTMELPAGKYYVYVEGVYNVNTGETYTSLKNKAYYNKHVTECMMKDKYDGKCAFDQKEYHEILNVVEVKAGQTINDINPWDWYYTPQNSNV